eukprot:TRINITY_DN14253_c0_g1_i1.p1 TRINITY_DN14253_c0_g1~~TRINITY_DN14253_c0_g1_i1.p1  ORF type:complete len:1526 (+),score=391.05 TRINITY_DN14253_c0_g1_i1:77-4579(+)
MAGAEDGAGAPTAEAPPAAEGTGEALGTREAWLERKRSSKTLDPIAAAVSSSQVPDGVIHSVSLAQFDLALGNTLSATRPETVDLGADVAHSALHDLCFPDGAHNANRDTVYAVLERKSGDGQLYAVGCYRALKTDTVSRGAVQRGLLVLTNVPLYNTLASILHDLLQWWLMCDDDANALASTQTAQEPGSPGSPDGLAGWVDVAKTCVMGTTVLEGRPRNPSAEDDLRFLDLLYMSLSSGLATRREDDRYYIIPFSFDYHHETVLEEDVEETGCIPGAQSPASGGSPVPSDGASPKRRMQRVFDRMKMVGLVGAGQDSTPTTGNSDKKLANRSFLGSPIGSDGVGSPVTSQGLKFPFGRRRSAAGPGASPSPSPPQSPSASEVEPPAGSKHLDVTPPKLDREASMDAVSDACIDDGAEEEAGDELPCDASVSCRPPELPVAPTSGVVTRGRAGGLLVHPKRRRVVQSSKKLKVELCAPFPTGSTGEQSAYGCCLSHLVRMFRGKLAEIYTALLHKQTVCFVGFGNAKDVGACVLACAHLIRPIEMPMDSLVPYFTVADASKVEKMAFSVCGTTNPFFEDPNRNKWAKVICNVSDASVTCHKSAAAVSKKTSRFISHVVQGVVEDCRTEAWVRNFFEWHTSRLLREEGVETYALAAGSTVAPNDSITRCEQLTTTLTACHEVNKRKTALHSEWFETMLEVLRPVAMRSGDSQRDMYKQISGFDLSDALGGFTDLTLSACASRTERAVIAQLAYEEQKTRRLLTEVRERVALLVDVLNRGNKAAAEHEDNQLFTDIFNTPDFQFYNIPSQILLFSTTCSIECRTLVPRTDGGEAQLGKEPIAKAACRVYISKHYLCLFANWRSRVGRVWATDAASPSEVIPFDAVDAIQVESSVVSDGIRLTLSTEFSGDGARNVLFIHDTKEAHKLLVLIETLVEKQKRTRAMLAAIDPELDVPDIHTKGPLGISRRVMIPTGLYLYDRVVDEEVFELGRSYPVAGWSSRLMPHDPPTFCDKSGKFERQFADEKKANYVELPKGWVWLTEWTVQAWEYNSDFKSKPYAWKGEQEGRGKMDICRRRKWTRTRRLEHDRLGTPLYVIGGAMAGIDVDGAAAVAAPSRSPAATALSPKEAPPSPAVGASDDPGVSPASFALRTRCRQSVPNLQAEPTSSGLLSSECFTPQSMLPQLPKKVDALALPDFASPAGQLSPFHPSAVLPGCGAERYEKGLPGSCKDELVLDELMAETSGMSPCPGGVGMASPSPSAAARERDREVHLKPRAGRARGKTTAYVQMEQSPSFNFSFQNDGAAALATVTPPQSIASTSFAVLSRGVVLLDAQEAEGNQLALAIESSKAMNSTQNSDPRPGSPYLDPLATTHGSSGVPHTPPNHHLRSVSYGPGSQTPPNRPVGLSALSKGMMKVKEKLKGDRLGDNMSSLSLNATFQPGVRPHSDSPGTLSPEATQSGGNASIEGIVAVESPKDPSMDPKQTAQQKTERKGLRRSFFSRS